MVPLKQLLSEPCELTGPAPQTWLETTSVHPSPLLSTTPFRTKHNEIFFPLDSKGKA